MRRSKRGLLRLPVEILCNILACLDMRDLLTCKTLRNAIQDSSRLQYIIELARRRMLSLIPPTIASPSYKSRLQLLRARERGWRHLAWKNRCTLDLGPTGSVYEFIGGIYGNGIEDDTRHPASISFLELPSVDAGAYNPSMGYSRLGPRKRDAGEASVRALWTHPMNGLLIVDFTMDPSEDLLVLVAHAPADSKYVYQVHLRSLSTNERHPKAPSEPLSCLKRPSLYTPPPPDSVGAVRVQVVGNLVALLIKEGVDHPGAHLQIWNWDSPACSSCILSTPSEIDDFTFLTQNAFLLVRTTGKFEVYTFNLTSSLSSSAPSSSPTTSPLPSSPPSISTFNTPQLRASYHFPQLSEGYQYSYISMSSNPPPGYVPKYRDPNDDAYLARPASTTNTEGEYQESPDLSFSSTISPSPRLSSSSFFSSHPQSQSQSQSQNPSQSHPSTPKTQRPQQQSYYPLPTDRIHAVCLYILQTTPPPPPPAPNGTVDNHENGVHCFVFFVNLATLLCPPSAWVGKIGGVDEDEEGGEEGEEEEGEGLEGYEGVEEDMVEDDDDDEEGSLVHLHLAQSNSHPLGLGRFGLGIGASALPTPSTSMIPRIHAQNSTATSSSTSTPTATATASRRASRYPPFPVFDSGYIVSDEDDDLDPDLDLDLDLDGEVKGKEKVVTSKINGRRMSTSQDMDEMDMGVSIRKPGLSGTGMDLDLGWGTTGGVSTSFSSASTASPSLKRHMVRRLAATATAMATTSSSMTLENRPSKRRRISSGSITVSSHPYRYSTSSSTSKPQPLKLSSSSSSSKFKLSSNPPSTSTSTSNPSNPHSKPTKRSKPKPKPRPTNTPLTSLPASTPPLHIPWDIWGPPSTRWFEECITTDWQHAIYGLRTVDSVPAKKMPVQNKKKQERALEKKKKEQEQREREPRRNMWGEWGEMFDADARRRERKGVGRDEGVDEGGREVMKRFAREYWGMVKKDKGEAKQEREREEAEAGAGAGAGDGPSSAGRSQTQQPQPQPVQPPPQPPQPEEERRFLRLRDFNPYNFASIREDCTMGASGGRRVMSRTPYAPPRLPREDLKVRHRVRRTKEEKARWVAEVEGLDGDGDSDESSGPVEPGFWRRWQEEERNEHVLGPRWSSRDTKGHGNGDGGDVKGKGRAKAGLTAEGIDEDEENDGCESDCSSCYTTDVSSNDEDDYAYVPVPPSSSSSHHSSRTPSSRSESSILRSYLSRKPPYGPSDITDPFNPSARFGTGSAPKYPWYTPRLVREASATRVNGVFVHDIVSWLPYVEVMSEETFDVTDVMMDDCRLLLLKRGATNKLERVEVLMI